MRLALYQPDIPQNVGSIIRLAACTGLPLDIIEPCGFPFDERRLKRVAMDYYGLAHLTRHRSWDAFRAAAGGRIVLFSTKSELTYVNFQYAENDTLLFGQETRGVPQAVHDAADVRVIIPLAPSARSLNVAMAAAMAAGEALRQMQRQ